MADVIIGDNDKVTDDGGNGHGVIRELVMMMVAVELVRILTMVTVVAWKCHRCFGVVLSVHINVRLVMVPFCFDRGRMLTGR